MKLKWRNRGEKWVRGQSGKRSAFLVSSRGLP